MNQTRIYFPLIILSLSDSDYPTVPIKFGYTGSWRRVITPIHTDTTVYAVYTATGSGGGGGGEIIIPPQPSSPGEIMSGGEGEPVENEPVEADAPAEDETVSPQGMHVTGTQTVTHEYLTLNGKVARETIRTNNTLTAVLDFIYDESGKPFALKYSTNGTSFQTYYYVLNLQGDVVKLIHYIPGFEYESVATYEYDAWGNIVSSSGRLAEINPLRYRGYYYDNETGFYYLQSRYYDPENHRFINADSYASTDSGDAIACNMFAYCGNNPVMRGDEDGEVWSKLVCMLVGAAVGALTSALATLTTGGSGRDVLKSAVVGAFAGGVIGFTGSMKAGKYVGRAVGSAISAVDAYVSARKAGTNVAGSCLAAGVAFSATYAAASISAGTGDDHTAGIMSDMTFGFSGALVSSSGTAIAEKVFAEKKDAAPQLPHVRQGANRRIVNPAMLM